MANQKTMEVSHSEQIWLKGTGTEYYVWTFSVSGIPTGSSIVSAQLDFTSGNTYNPPGRTEIFWGSSEIAANRIWYVSNSSGGGSATTVDITSRITGNGSYSMMLRKTANSAGTQSNVYFSGLKVTITYIKPYSTIKLCTSGSLVSYNIYHAENGVLVPYSVYRAESGSLVKY